MLIRKPFFFFLYRFFPHKLMNLLTRWLMQAKRPRFLIRWYLARWIRRASIPMQEFQEEEYACVEDFFLRRIKPEARPIEGGFISPVDGLLLGYGKIAADTILQVKGMPISIQQMINGSLYDRSLDAWEGGSYITIFLTPDGYHRIHQPCDAEIREVLWLPGRFFPQNEVAIHHIPKIYERNERASLCCYNAQGIPFWMTLVGASLIGGIHLTGIPRSTWVKTTPVELEKQVKKGEEIAHFSFGSTIVLLFPPAMGLSEPKDAKGIPYPLGQSIKMGQTLAWFEPEKGKGAQDVSFADRG